MRLPRIRFTVRRLMIAVAVVGLGSMGILRSWELYNQLRAELHSRMAEAYHLKANRLIDDLVKKAPGRRF